MGDINRKPVHILTLGLNPSSVGGPYVFSYLEYGELVRVNPVESLEYLQQLVRYCYQRSLSELKPLVVAIQKDGYHAKDSSALYKIASQAVREAAEASSCVRPAATRVVDERGKSKHVFEDKVCSSDWQVLAPKVVYLTTKQMYRDLFHLPKHRKSMPNTTQTTTKMKRVATKGLGLDSDGLNKFMYLVPITCFGYWVAFKSRQVQDLLQAWSVTSTTYGY